VSLIDIPRTSHNPTLTHKCEGHTRRPLDRLLRSVSHPIDSTAFVARSVSVSASPLPGLRTLRGRRSTHRGSRGPSCAHKLRWLEGWQVPFIIAPTENRHMRQEAQAICHLLPLGCAPHALGSPCSRATSSLPCQRSTRDRACRSHRRRRRCCRLHPRPHQPHPRVSRSATCIRLGPLMMPFPGKAPLHVLYDRAVQRCSHTHTCIA